MRDTNQSSQVKQILIIAIPITLVQAAFIVDKLFFHPEQAWRIVLSPLLSVVGLAVSVILYVFIAAILLLVHGLIVGARDYKE